MRYDVVKCAQILKIQQFTNGIVIGAAGSVVVRA